MGKTLPLHNFYVTNLCWIRCMLNAIAVVVPKRLKKNANAVAKDTVCIDC